MKIRKMQLLVLQAILLLILVGHTSMVKADTVGAKMFDQFEYEYEGQTMIYKIYHLPTDTEPGIAALIRAKDQAELSGELHIPATVTYIGASYSVTRIEHDAFNGCSNITSVNIPQGITYIGWNAFYHCISLSEIAFADSVTEIGDAAFSGCVGLKSIELSPKLKTVAGAVFYKCTGLESVIIPEGLTSINSEAFENCTALKSIYLPSSLTSIASDAFKGTDSVYSVFKDSYAAKFCKDHKLRCTYVFDTESGTISLDDISLKQYQLTLYTGEQASLTLLYYPMNTSDDRTVLWSSSNPTVAAVESNGIVTALSPGKAVITAAVGALSAKATVIVNPYTPKSVTAISKSINSIRISWKPVIGVSGYTVYRATSENGKFTKIKDITCNYYKDSTYYIDTSLNYKSTYYYKVRSYSYGRSHLSKAVSAKPQIAVPQISASSVKNDKIKIQWSWVNGSQGYHIYRSSSKNGDYKLYKTVTSSYYTDTAVTKGKTYYYYVTAFYKDNKKKVYSQSSNKVNAAAKTPSTPKLVTLGTTLADVYKILGRTNRKVYAEGYLELLYRKDFMDSSGLSTAHIYLQKVNGDYVVIGWANLFQGGLSSKVSDGYNQNTDSFTLGSSLTEVLKAMETPDSFEIDFAGGIYFGPGDFIVIKTTGIRYKDGSTVSFNSDMRVIAWENKGCLKLKNSTVKPTQASITLGTSLTEVMKALGNPKEIEENGWNYPKYVHYGDAVLTFDANQLLIQWENKGNLNIAIGQKAADAPKLQAGSTLGDVIKALGTPDSYYADGIDPDALRQMAYGKYTIHFGNNQCVSRITKTEGYLTTEVTAIDATQ